MPPHTKRRLTAGDLSSVGGLQVYSPTALKRALSDPEPVSKVVPSKSNDSNRIGTEHWTAPEGSKGVNADNEVDQ